MSYQKKDSISKSDPILYTVSKSSSKDTKQTKKQDTNMQKTSSRNRSSTNHSKRNATKNNNSLDGTKDAKYSKANINFGKQLNDKQQLFTDTEDFLSVIKGSKKGVNITHLLNYEFEPDNDDDDKNNNSNNNNNNKNRRKNNFNTRKRNPEQEITLSGLSYINANYKFILKQNGDYNSQLLDPNLPIDIHNIERVIVKQHDYHCAICLADDFVAPRMMKCGHIFCYSCILSMFENIKNDTKKTSIGNMHNPSIFCPLCSEVLKYSFIMLPVLIDQVTDSDKVFDVNKNHTLDLMYRGNSKIYSQKISDFYHFKDFKGTIPWISKNCTPLNYKQLSPYIKYSRLMICDSEFLIACYQKEIDDLLTQKLLDSEVYGDDVSSFDIAVSSIKKKIELIAENNETLVGPDQIKMNNPDSNHLEIFLPSYKDGFYYYQCEINSRIHYFLSPLDIDIMKTLFKIPDPNDLQSNKLVDNPAQNLPLVLNVFVENISTEINKITPSLVTKYPFLGNLPYGSEVAFLEINWTKFDNSFIPLTDMEIEKYNGSTRNGKYPVQIPDYLIKRLENRTKSLKNKRVYEERERLRGEKQREKETLEIFSKDNKPPQYTEEDNFIFANANYDWNENQFSHIENDNGTPILKGVSGFNLLSIEGDDNESDDKNKSYVMETSVWGTRVPVVVDPEEEALKNEENRKFDEMIRQAKNSALASSGKGKKGKKLKRIQIPL